MSIPRVVLAAVIGSFFGIGSVLAQTTPLDLDRTARTNVRSKAKTRTAYPTAPPRIEEPQSHPRNFLEALFGGFRAPQFEAGFGYDPDRNMSGQRSQPVSLEPEHDRRPLDPKFLPQTVSYDGPEQPGTVIIDTPSRLLYLVQEDGKAKRYGIGVGRPGFTWAGVLHVSSKREWPEWVPPPEMLARRPDLPHYMRGGRDNPLGARAMYLGSSLYRIHGSNEPWTIGTAVSSGCIRMRNEDVIDLYERVRIGTKVIVI